MHTAIEVAIILTFVPAGLLIAFLLGRNALIIRQHEKLQGLYDNQRATIAVLMRSIEQTDKLAQVSPGDEWGGGKGH